MSDFIWNMNTFEGRFVNLPVADSPKENSVGAYALSIRDFNLHSTRTVDQNALYYAFIVAFLEAGKKFISAGCWLPSELLSNTKLFSNS